MTGALGARRLLFHKSCYQKPGLRQEHHDKRGAWATQRMTARSHAAYAERSLCKYMSGAIAARLPLFHKSCYRKPGLRQEDHDTKGASATQRTTARIHAACAERSLCKNMSGALGVRMPLFHKSCYQKPFLINIICMKSGHRCLVLGVRWSVLGARRSVLRARCSVLGAQCSVFGAS